VNEAMEYRFTTDAGECAAVSIPRTLSAEDIDDLCGVMKLIVGQLRRRKSPLGLSVIEVPTRDDDVGELHRSKP